MTSPVFWFTALTLPSAHDGLLTACSNSFWIICGLFGVPEWMTVQDPSEVWTSIFTIDRLGCLKCFMCFLHSVCSSHYVIVQLWQSKKHYTKNQWFFYFDFQQEATVDYNWHGFPLVLELKVEKKVVHEVRLSKPLMVIAIIAAVGLFAIGLRPVIEATPAFASIGVHQVKIVGKVAICDLCSK